MMPLTFMLGLMLAQNAKDRQFGLLVDAFFMPGAGDYSSDDACRPADACGWQFLACALANALANNTSGCLRLMLSVPFFFKYFELILLLMSLVDAVH